MMKYDIVIPVSYKDCWILKKNIRYIRDNLIGANKIYVILNRDLFRCFKSDFLSKYSVYLIDENCLALNLNFKEVKNALFEKGLDRLTGWYFQQFLKMAFAFYENVEDYYQDKLNEMMSDIEKHRISSNLVSILDCGDAMKLSETVNNMKIDKNKNT